jgi:hypothetical protein
MVFPAAFSIAVLHVVLVRSEPQMRWIATSRIVAVMKYMQAIWYWAIKERPCVTMCENIITTCNSTVTQLINLLCPWLTAVLPIGFVNIIPEVIYNSISRSFDALKRISVLAHELFGPRFAREVS